jgi:hypothetical protein
MMRIKQSWPILPKFLEQFLRQSGPAKWLGGGWAFFWFIAALRRLWAAPCLCAAARRLWAAPCLCAAARRLWAAPCLCAAARCLFVGKISQLFKVD